MDIGKDYQESDRVNKKALVFQKVEMVNVRHRLRANLIHRCSVSKILIKHPNSKATDLPSLPSGDH